MAQLQWDSTMRTASVHGMAVLLLLAVLLVWADPSAIAQTCPSNASCNALFGSVVIPSRFSTASNHVFKGEAPSPDGLFYDEFIGLTFNRSWDRNRGSGRDDSTQPLASLDLESYWNGNAEFNLDLSPANSNSLIRPFGYSAAYNGSAVFFSIGGPAYSSGASHVQLYGGTGAGVLLALSGGVASNTMLQMSAATDSTPRFTLAVTGNFKWGSGSAAADTDLYRSGPNTLSTDGDLVVGGNLAVTGEKSALVVTTSYGQRKVYAVESPGEWFEDFGNASLVKAKAIVQIDPVFGETVSADKGYHVFLTPTDKCSLYIANKRPTFFEVRRLGGSHNCAFDYRIVAKRRGYENVRLAYVPDVPLTSLSEEFARLR